MTAEGLCGSANCSKSNGLVGNSRVRFSHKLQSPIAQGIVDCKADYLLVLKVNHGHGYTALQHLGYGRLVHWWIFATP
jgi:hypothetical protein